MKRILVLMMFLWVMMRFNTLQSLLDYMNKELNRAQQNSASIINGTDEHSNWLMGNWILIYNNSIS